MNEETFVYLIIRLGDDYHGDFRIIKAFADKEAAEEEVVRLKTNQEPCACDHTFSYHVTKIQLTP